MVVSPLSLGGAKSGFRCYLLHILPCAVPVDLGSIWSPALSHHVSHRRQKHSVPVRQPNTKSLPWRIRNKYNIIVRRESPSRLGNAGSALCD